MDPVTGIGLAASVIQLVNFSIDAVRTYRELHQHGSVSEYSNLDYTTGHLASLTKSLQQSLQSSGTRSLALTREEKDLIDLGRNCEDCAHRLQHELRRVQTQPRASALEAARKAARAIWKGNSIRKIQEQLETYQSTLETSLLYRLSQQLDVQGLRSSKSFVDLDERLQHVITCLANSQTSLATLMVEESEQTRQYITTQIDRIERLHIDSRLYEDVTRSLFYPDIFSRQEQVDNEFDGIEESYNWIFDESQTPRLGSFDRHSRQKRVRPWDNFARWLRSGHGVYWINGKAGSGKSTLMNYICNHNRRLELLREWCPQRRLLTPTFFFWNAGPYQNKSIDGLLRSLIYQMLTECHELIGCFKNEPLHAWNERRLTTALLSLLRQAYIPVAICMFIDGLDEFDGRYESVIKMIKDLADQTHVKICLSSRPLLAFEEAFNGTPSLRLQNLTFYSIWEYADLQLSGLIQQRVSNNKYDRDQAEELLTRIVQRADGVFLWAVIAVRKVRDGLQDIVDMNELAQEIEMLPSELEGLFMLILNRIGPVYQRYAAQFLQITLYHVQGGDVGAMDLCRLHFIHSQREVEDAPFSHEKVTTSELVEACRTLRTRLLSHTAGLLELTPTDKGSRIYSKSEDYDPVLFTKINFLHRTAREFLLNNSEAKSFLAHKGSKEVQVRLSIARGTFAQLAQFSHKDARIIDDAYYPHAVFFPFLAALQQVSMVERLVGAAQSKLMRSLDYESFVWERPAAKSLRVYPASAKAFMITGRSGTSIDLVGMAAAVSMTLYVCEQLGLSVESRSYSPSLPDLKDYSRNGATAAILSWNGLNDSRDPDTAVATQLRSSSYRQSLGECLQWKVDARKNSHTDAQSVSNPLAETYILSCCTATCLDLPQILLRAGANPMVQFELPKLTFFQSMIGSFWESWLQFLQELRCHYMLAYRRSGGLVLHNIDIDLHVTLDDIFNTTKALLAHGADINYQMEGADSSYYKCYLKRQDLQDEQFDFTLTASAMFTLEECFNKEPEFRQFAVAMEPLVQSPTRKIISIYLRKQLEGSFAYYETYPSAEESELLWPLIEEWESTGHRNDLDALQSAMGRVWRAHDPDVKSKEQDTNGSAKCD